MNTTKKLLVICMVAMLALASVIPASFSWYNRAGSQTGNSFKITKENLPVSMKTSSNSVSISTVDDSGTAVASTSIPNVEAGQTKKFVTTISNSGSNPVMVDLNLRNVTNLINLYIGTTFPTLNEKTYTSRASIPTKDETNVRVYFRTYYNSGNYWKDYWNNYSSAVSLPSGTPYAVTSTSNYSSYKYDFNIMYYNEANPNGVWKRMDRCPNTISSSSYADKYVFYADIPANATKIYFFNHYYVSEKTNKIWNKTPDITDIEPGSLYTLTGAENNEQSKEYSITKDDQLANVYKYYDPVRLAIGQTANIAMKSGSDNHYIGKEVSYSVTEGKTYINVNKDGLITAKKSTTVNNEEQTAQVTTKVKGHYGDTIDVVTNVNIPKNISQLPVLQNIEVAPDSTVDVEWYIKNKLEAADDEQETTAGIASLFFTV